MTTKKEAPDMIEANTLEGIKNGKADSDSNKSLQDDEAPAYVKVCRPFNLITYITRQVTLNIHQNQECDFNKLINFRLTTGFVDSAI